MKLYLAGPITSHKEQNFSAFGAETARLRALGYEVVSPAETTPTSMRVNIALLTTCDSVAMLDGWTASRSARLEHHVALELGLQPRLSAFFIDIAPLDTCTRCGGAHKLSRCNWPLVAADDPAHAASI